MAEELPSKRKILIVGLRHELLREEDVFDDMGISRPSWLARRFPKLAEKLKPPPSRHAQIMQVISSIPRGKKVGFEATPEKIRSALDPDSFDLGNSAYFVQGLHRQGAEIQL